MPIYEYECDACGDDHEIIQKMGARTLRKCPSCGALKLRRKISRSAFHLKGAGWYVTDYASKGETKEANSESAVSDSQSQGKSAENKEAAAKGGGTSSETKKEKPSPVATG